jgi:hypothetical protein
MAPRALSWGENTLLRGLILNLLCNAGTFSFQHRRCCGSGPGPGMFHDYQ